MSGHRYAERRNRLAITEQPDKPGEVWLSIGWRGSLAMASEVAAVLARLDIEPAERPGVAESAPSR